MLCCVVLCCAVLCCVVLCCVVLCCAVLGVLPSRQSVLNSKSVLFFEDYKTGRACGLIACLIKISVWFDEVEGKRGLSLGMMITFCQNPSLYSA